MHAGMLPTKQSTVTSRYLQSKTKYTSPEADITQESTTTMRNIFVDNFMISNFCLGYIFDKTYRFQEKLKKSENFNFNLE